MAKRDPSKTYGIFGLLWRMIFVGGFVFLLTAAGSYAAVWYLVKTPESITPDLLTLELTDAVDQASEEGFSVLIDHYEATDLLGSGRVLSQSPSPGAIVKQGARIRVTVASSP